MRENVDFINTAVVPLVGVVCSRKQEVGRVIDSCEGVSQGCVGASEGEVEGASWVLWLDGAGDGEAVVPEHLQPLLLVLGDPQHGGRQGDTGLEQDICKQRSKETKK